MTIERNKLSAIDIKELIEKYKPNRQPIFIVDYIDCYVNPTPGRNAFKDDFMKELISIRKQYAKYSRQTNAHNTKAAI